MNLVLEKETPAFSLIILREMRYLINTSEKLRKHVIKRCIAGEITINSSASRLGLSVRYTKN